MVLTAKNYDLAVIDEGISVNTALSEDCICLSRPVRLLNLIHAIHYKLENKSQKPDVILTADYLLSLVTRSINYHDGKIIITLTEKECELLQAIAERKTLLTREILLEQVWGYSKEIDTHTLETHIYRLRSKLKQVNEKLDIIFADNEGYYLNNA